MLSLGAGDDLGHSRPAGVQRCPAFDAFVDLAAPSVDRLQRHNGCVWRALPADLPPWRTVYGLFQRWHARGVTIALHDALRAAARQAAGRDTEPMAAVIDSPSVRAAPTVPKASRGWDNAKKVNGRKRHIAVDTTGLLLEVLATPARVQDRDAARPLLFNLHRARRRVRRAGADAVYWAMITVMTRRLARGDAEAVS